MSLINPALLYGLGLAALPVILHFLLRSKPKKLLFPALRLLMHRRKTNVRRLRLRHLWLLLVRIAVIAAIVLAVARPSLPAANYSLTGGELLRLGAVVLGVVAVYSYLLHRWRRQGVPLHVFTYRRTLLRGGSGLAAVLLALLLVAWPYQRRITAEITTPTPAGARKLPVAGVFLFDTSLSMQYRHESRTRLEHARDIARDHLSKLPAGSRIAFADTASREPIVFQADLAGAAARIGSLATQATSATLDDRLMDALAAQLDDYRQTLDVQSSVPESDRKDQFLRGVFVFTDLTSAAWRENAARLLERELERLPWVYVYLIDVGVEDPQNAGITQVRLSSQTVPQGSDLSISAVVEGTGAGGGTRTVELHVGRTPDELTKRGQASVEAGATGARPEFFVRGLTGPMAYGEVRLNTSDPYPVDDVRYFTVAVVPPPEVLVVGESADAAVYWQYALAPPGLTVGQRYQVTFRRAADLARAGDLDRFDVIALLDLAAPGEATWQTLAAYVERGGGLAVIVGRLAQPQFYWTDTARGMLPGELLAARTFDPPQLLDLRDLSHPILQKFQQLNTVGRLGSVDVVRAWNVEPIEGERSSGRVILRYTDPDATPALLERDSGQGRVVMLTTGVDLQGWSDLPRATWEFPALADQVTRYLAGRQESVFNYVAGQTAAVPLDAERPVRQYLIRKPARPVDLQLRGTVPDGADFLTRDDTDLIGHYTIVAAEGESSFSSGFAVNAPPEESNFERLSGERLDALFGKDRYRVARDLENLELIVNTDRLGTEVYPQILFLVLVVFCAEHLIANRFYEADQW
ncbi:MAG TPA: BatA and WFA domain-containing protein [Planctomycetaceae bacterium]|nr:BatA and WFA domain-containing protein [Planctomycetaceae bacterium]